MFWVGEIAKNGQIIPIDQQVLLSWIGTTDILEKAVSHQHRLLGVETDYCKMWQEAVGCHTTSNRIMNTLRLLKPHLHPSQIAPKPESSSERRGREHVRSLHVVFHMKFAQNAAFQLTQIKSSTLLPMEARIFVTMVWICRFMFSIYIYV